MNKNPAQSWVYSFFPSPLDDDVLEFVEKIAKKKNIDIQTVVNQLLPKMSD